MNKRYLIFCRIFCVYSNGCSSCLSGTHLTNPPAYLIIVFISVHLAGLLISSVIQLANLLSETAY